MTDINHSGTRIEEGGGGGGDKYSPHKTTAFTCVVIFNHSITVNYSWKLKYACLSLCCTFM